MNYIITNRKEYFEKIGDYNYCDFNIFKDKVKDKKEVAVDTETTGLMSYKSEIFAVQIGTGQDNFLFDIDSGINIPDIFDILTNKILVFHNALFDLSFLYKYNIFPWKVRDTLLARKIMYNGLPMKRHDFGTVMEEELQVHYDKSEQKNINKIRLSTSKAIQYCFNDVDKLLELKNTLHKQIVKGGYIQTYNLHCRWIRACAYMQVCGLPINEQKWKEKIENDKKELQEKEKVVNDYILNNLPEFRKAQLSLFSDQPEVEVLLTSPTQMIKVFEKFGIDTTDPDTKAGKSISKNIINKSKHEFVDIWLDYQSIKHDVTTFGENFLYSVYNGRLYTNYKPLLDTARISAGGKNKDKTEADNVNTLNIPANQKSREPFEAKDGFKIIDCDYSAQETVTGADYYNDPVMIESVVNDLDLHCAFARVLYPEIAELSDDEIKQNHKDKRNASKAPRFLFQFGGGAFTLQKNENIPLEEAKKIEEGFKLLHPGIYEYGNNKFKEVVNLGYIESIYGFKLHLPYFEDFKKRHNWIQGLNKKFWDQYKIGKKEYKAKNDSEEYVIPSKNMSSYELYKKSSYDISQYFKKKGDYMRLCLNNGAQTKAAHQTKAATNSIYEYIWRNKHFWKARIACVIHDN